MKKRQRNLSNISSPNSNTLVILQPIVFEIFYFKVRVVYLAVLSRKIKFFHALVDYRHFS